MTEYIVAELDLNRLVVNYMESRMSLYSPISEPERVVRCKDCKHCEVADWTNYILYEYHGSEIKHLCHEFADYEGTPMVVEPDGFCAWGERREDD